MNAIAKVVDHLPAAPAPTESAIDRIISAALNQDFDIEKMKELYALKQQFDADEARKAYVAAMAAFKAEPLRILKDKHVKFQTAKGTTEYDHATIGNVVEVITGRLGQFQLAHRWDTMQENGKITVTCVITHAQGHSESTTLTASPDDSGGKNGIQSIASTVTYLQRYTLLAATGMATRDQVDNDGAGFDADDTEAAEQAMRVIDQWIDHLKSRDTREALAQAKKEVIEAYHGEMNLPNPIRQAYNERLAELKAAAQ